MKIFALYKGEQEIAFGTIKEIAKKLNLKEETIRFYKYESYQKRSKKNKNRKILIET